MKNFLAIFTGSPEAMVKSGWNNLTSEKRKELEVQGMKAWGLWMSRYANSIVVQGGPLGKTKKINADGISSTTNNLAGYVVIKAASHEEAAQMFINHPHFSIFPGESVEIMECLEIPKLP